MMASFNFRKVNAAMEEEMREKKVFGFTRRARALSGPQTVEMPVRQGETVLVPACVEALEFIPDAAGAADGQAAPHFKLLTSYIA